MDGLLRAGHISSEPVQFQNNCTIPAYGFCIVVGNSHTISIGNCMDESEKKCMTTGKLHKVKPSAICMGNRMDESWKNCTETGKSPIVSAIFPKSHSHP